jgi:hypothetical protein
MPIRYTKTTAHLEGECTVEEALDLAEWLRAPSRKKVDLSACTHVHASVLQCLIALAPTVAAPFGDALLAQRLQPLLPPTSRNRRR